MALSSQKPTRNKSASSPGKGTRAISHAKSDTLDDMFDQQAANRDEFIAGRAKNRFLDASELPASVRNRMLTTTTTLQLSDRVVAYVRESSPGQIETSAPRQIDNVNAYSIRLRLHIDEYYHDEGKTGTTIEERDEFQRMMRDARAGKFRIIVCEAIDRFSRNLADLFRAYEELCKLGIELHDATVGKLSLAQIIIMGYMAEEGRRRFLELTRGGFRRALQSGQILAGIPYGYKRHLKKKGALQKVKSRVDVVVKIFTMVAQGLGSTAIADYLNKAGYPAPSRCRSSDLGQAVGVDRSAWDAQAITRIVRHEIYGGFYIYGKCWRKRNNSPGSKTTEPRLKEKWVAVDVPEYRCVEPELWRAANEQLDAKNFGLEASHERSGTGLLAGRIFCSQCGSPLHMRKPDVQVYRCSSHISSKVKRCTVESAPRVDFVESAVIGLIEESILDQRQIERYRSEVREAIKRAEKEKQTDRVSASVRLEKVKRLLFASLDKSLLEGASSQHQIEYRRALETEANSLKDRLDGLAKNVDENTLFHDLEALKNGVAEMRRALPFNTRPIENAVLVKLFRKLVHRVVVHPRDANNMIALDVDYAYGQSVPGLDIPSAALRNMRVVIDVNAKNAEVGQARWDKRMFPIIEAATNHVYDISDATWSLIEDLVKGVNLSVDGKLHDGRTLVNTVICILKTGCSITLPHPVFGDPKTNTKLIRRMVTDRTWESIVTRLQDKAPQVLDGIPAARLFITAFGFRLAPGNKSAVVWNPTPQERKKQAAELRKRATYETRPTTKKALGIMALYIDGLKTSDITATFSVTSSYVSYLAKRYKNLGIAGLLPNPEPTNGSRLLPHQIAKLVAMAKTDKDPFNPNLRTSYKALARWCFREFAAQYHPKGIRWILAKCGMSLGRMRNEAAVMAKNASQANRRQVKPQRPYSRRKPMDEAA